jgi:CheY-like chemotaxis protein
VSLTGNLEDLPLLDILQIVSFSKKTGHLSILTRSGEGGIIFHDGLVVSAFTWDTFPIDTRVSALPQEKRLAFVRNRIEMALEQLIRLREGQFSFSLTESPPRKFGARDITLEMLPSGINPQQMLLDLARGIDEDRRDSSAALEATFARPDELQAPRDEDQGTTMPFFLRAAGTAQAAAEPPAETPPEPDVDVFYVEPDDAVLRAGAEPVPAPPLDPSPPNTTHSSGVLHMPEPRVAEAEAKGGAATRPIPVMPPPAAPASLPPAATAEPAASSLEAAPPPGHDAIRTLLVVDDEDLVRHVLTRWFVQAGYQVEEAESPEAAVKAGGRLSKAGEPFVLVTDLGMPTTGGSSFHGGFEVVKRLWKMNLRPPVLMMAESLDPTLKLRAKQMGISSFVFKPGLSKLNERQFEADLLAFADRLLADVIPRLCRPTAVRASASAPASKRAAPTLGPPTVEELSRQLEILQRRLQELRQPGDATQISILIMKVAREFFERGILFIIKNDEARGLGGFGLTPKGQNMNLLVREVAVPLGEPSVFAEVVSRGKLYSGPLPDGRWSRHVIGKIGRFRSRNVSVLPLLTHREAIALLFGDNPETGREFGRLDALEVFMQQAGVAIENVFLQRKLNSLQGKE